MITEEEIEAVCTINEEFFDGFVIMGFPSGDEGGNLTIHRGMNFNNLLKISTLLRIKAKEFEELATRMQDGSPPPDPQEA